MRWPNSHSFQWLKPPTKAFCRLFESWEVAGWKEYLTLRQLGDLEAGSSWTLPKSGSFPKLLGVGPCSSSEVRDLLRSFGPTAAQLAAAKLSAGATTAAADSRTAAAAAAQPHSLSTPSGPVQYRVSLLDGLSLPLTIAHAVRSVGWRATAPAGASSNVTIVMAGASRRAEQRIAACTPYLRELGLALRSAQGGAGTVPVRSISVLLVGPEVAMVDGNAIEGSSPWISVPSYAPAGSDATPTWPQLRYACVRDTLHGLLGREWGWNGGTNAGTGLFQGAHRGNTLIVTVNPGYGNLFSSLTKAWLPSLHAALRSRCVVVGLCANHDGDALGEHALLHRGFPGCVQQLAEAQRSPFGSMSTWVGGEQDAQASATEKRAKQLAAAMQCDVVGDSSAYAGQAYWYAVRGQGRIHVAPEMATAAAFQPADDS